MELFKSDEFNKVFNIALMDKILRNYVPSKEMILKTFLICLTLKSVFIALSWIRFFKSNKRNKLNRTVSRYDNRVLVDVDCSSIDLCQKSIAPLCKKKSALSSIIGFPFLPIKFFYQTFIDQPFDNLSSIFKLFFLILIELKSIVFTPRVKKTNSKILFSQNIERFNQNLLNSIDKDSNSIGGSLKYRRPKHLVSRKNSSFVSVNKDISKKGSSRFKIEYKLKKLKSNHLFLNLNKKNDSIKDIDLEKTKNIIKFKVDQTTYSRKTSKNLSKQKSNKTKTQKKLDVFI